MSVMASPITSNSTACSSLQQRKHQTAIFPTLYEKNPAATGVFPPQRASYASWRHQKLTDFKSLRLFIIRWYVFRPSSSSTSSTVPRLSCGSWLWYSSPCPCVLSGCSFTELEFDMFSVSRTSQSQLSTYSQWTLRFTALFGQCLSLSMFRDPWSVKTSLIATEWAKLM